MSGSDVEALTRSFRARIALLVGLLALGLAAALWASTRPSGIGDPEDRRKILIVTRGSDIDYHALFERAGFVTAIDDYDDWLAEARTARLGTEAEGVALMLELADLRGFAVVVFERPSELELGDLELEPALDELDPLTDHEYLALSVGDFGFPHRVTLDGLESPAWVRLPGYGALEAVFAQSLISTRAEPNRPTIAELQFEDAISLGRHMIEDPAEFAQLVESARVGVVDALDDGSGARAVTAAWETGTVIPTPDGGILLVHRELEIFSADARSLALEPGSQVQLSWLGPEAVAHGIESGEFRPEPCPSLAGGVLPIAELARLTTADDGSAVAIDYAEGGVTVWRKTSEPGCEWAAIADLEQAEVLVLASQSDGSELATAVAASLGASERSGQVVAWALPNDPDDPNHRLEPELVLEATDRRFGALVFVDDQHLAVTSTPSPVDPTLREDRIDLLDRTRPGVHLSVPTEFFAADQRIRELVPLAPATASSGPELLVATMSGDGRIELLRLRIGADAWATFSEAEAEPTTTMITLIPEQLEVERLLDLESMADFAVGPGVIVFGTGSGTVPGEIVRFDLDTRSVRALTNNRIDDQFPRVAADGSYAAFISFAPISLSTTPFGVPRVLGI